MLSPLLEGDSLEVPELHLSGTDLESLLGPPATASSPGDGGSRPSVLRGLLHTPPPASPHGRRAASLSALLHHRTALLLLGMALIWGFGAYYWYGASPGRWIDPTTAAPAPVAAALASIEDSSPTNLSAHVSYLPPPRSRQIRV